MSHHQKNSMAAILSAFVRVIFWISVIFGATVFIMLCIGLAGSLNGGLVQLPFIEARVDDVPTGRLIAALVSLLVSTPGIAFICAQLERILTTLADGDPFLPENAPRLSRIAIAIGLIEAVRMVSLILLSQTVDLGAGYTANIGLNLTVWGAVIVLFILAQVFREGTRLREEEKMTI